MRCAGLFLLILMLTNAARAAEGNELFAYSAIHKGLGGSGAGRAYDGTWLLVNPAAIVDLDRRLDFSLELMHVRLLAEPAGVPLVTNPFAGAMDFRTWLPIPAFTVVVPRKEFTYGAGIIVVAGHRTNLDHPRITAALIGNGDRRAGNVVAQIPIAVAHRFDNGWSIGAAIVPAVQGFRTDTFTTRIRITQGDYEWDWAGGLGYMLAVHRNFGSWSIGAAYTSPNWMQDLNKYKKDLVCWPLDLPEKVQAGIAWRANDNLDILLDYKWVNWSGIELFGHTTLNGGLGLKDQRLVKLGVNWRINDRWTVRAGVSAGNAVVTDKHVFVNLLTPAVAKVHAGAGISHQIDAHSSVHVTYSQAIPRDEVESGRGDFVSALGRGSKAGYREYSLTAQYAYTF